MAVVVNDVEVVPAERGTRPAMDQDKAAGEEAPPSEHDIRRIVEQQMIRSERIWAH